MHLVITLTAAALIVVGAFYSYESSEEIKRVVATTEATPSAEVQGEETETVEIDMEDESLPVTLTSTPTPQNTLTPSSTNTPQPTITKNTVSISDYVYPGATVKSNSANSTLLEVSGNVDTVTDWYKAKIKSQGMNITNFVVTKTNDVTKNVLVGGKNGEDVDIEITQSGANGVVRIEVALAR